jgi:hypothetical protein
MNSVEVDTAPEAAALQYGDVRHRKVPVLAEELSLRKIESRSKSGSMAEQNTLDGDGSRMLVRLKTSQAMHHHRTSTTSTTPQRLAPIVVLDKAGCSVDQLFPLQS